MEDQGILRATSSDKNTFAGLPVVNSSILRDDFADKLLSEAAKWVGTPFAHQGKLKQVGVDCANFIDACFRAAGVDTEPIPKNYSRVEDGSLMLSLLKTHLLYVPREFASPADVIAFCDEACIDKDTPRHLAFVDSVTPTTMFIYEAGRRGCVRHRLDGTWLRRITSIWRYPR